MQTFINEVIDVDKDAAKNAKQAYEITPALLEDSVITVLNQMKEDQTRGHMVGALTPDVRETGSMADRLEYILKDLGLPTRKAKGKPAAPPPS